MGLVILGSRERGSQAVSPRAKGLGNAGWVSVGPEQSKEPEGI